MRVQAAGWCSSPGCPRSGGGGGRSQQGTLQPPGRRPPLGSPHPRQRRAGPRCKEHLITKLQTEKQSRKPAGQLPAAGATRAFRGAGAARSGGHGAAGPLRLVPDQGHLCTQRPRSHEGKEQRSLSIAPHSVPTQTPPHLRGQSVQTSRGSCSRCGGFEQVRSVPSTCPASRQHSCKMPARARTAVLSHYVCRDLSRSSRKLTGRSLFCFVLGFFFLTGLNLSVCEACMRLRSQACRCPEPVLTASKPPCPTHDWGCPRAAPGAPLTGRSWSAPRTMPW